MKNDDSALIRKIDKINKEGLRELREANNKLIISKPNPSKSKLGIVQVPMAERNASDEGFQYIMEVSKKKAKTVKK